MSTIDLSKSHTLSIEDAKKKAEEIAKSMGDKFGISWKWDGDSIRFDAPSGAAKGTKGELSVTSNLVRIQIDLPFMLKMLKGTIEGKVKEKLDQLV